MTVNGYFINEDQQLRVFRALDVLCLAMRYLRANNEKRGDEPDDYAISCLEIVYETIAETMYDITDNKAQKSK